MADETKVQENPTKLADQGHSDHENDVVLCGKYHFRQLSPNLKFSCHIFCEVQMKYGDFKQNVTNVSSAEETSHDIVLSVGAEAFVDWKLYSNFREQPFAVCGFMPNVFSPDDSCAILNHLATNSYFLYHFNI